MRKYLSCGRQNYGKISSANNPELQSCAGEAKLRSAHGIESMRTELFVKLLEQVESPLAWIIMTWAISSSVATRSSGPRNTVACGSCLGARIMARYSLRYTAVRRLSREDCHTMYLPIMTLSSWLVAWLFLVCLVLSWPPATATPQPL